MKEEEKQKQESCRLHWFSPSSSSIDDYINLQS